MATYCTPEDVRLALTPSGSANDGEQTAASLPTWQLQDAADEAEDTINAYLSDYQIILVTIEADDIPDDDPNQANAPITVAPNPVRRWTRSIAAYFAALTFRKNKDLPEDDPVRLRYQAVMGMLALVKSGEFTLNLPKSETSGHSAEIFNLYDGTLFGPRDFCLGPDQQHVQVFIPGSTEYFGGY